MAIAADAPRQTRASEALFRRLGGDPRTRRIRHGEIKKCSERTRIERSRLSRIANGKTFPRADEGSRLVEEGIPIHWWDEPPADETQPADPAKPAA